MIKMKNKSIALISACAAGLIMAGCNKNLLNTSLDDSYVESNFWTSSAAAKAALAGAYSTLTSTGLFGGVATPLFEETATPNAYNYDNSAGFGFLAEGKQMPSSEGIIQSRWHDCYAGIGRCNTLLARVDKVEELEDADRTKIKGEAHFLRALYYFMLENYYGGVPLVLDVPDPETQSNLPRTSREEVVTQILADLDEAASVLPVKATGANTGHATKGAALALKARVLLFEASPLFGGPSGNWQAAADAAKAVIELAPEAGYGLFDDYRSLFLPENENNKEVIFDVQFLNPDLGHSFDLIDKQYNTNAPLLDLAQAYEMKNGLPITDPSSGYDAANPYVDRDPRLYQTIVFPGDTFMTVPVTPSRFAITGYGLKKYSIYDKGAPPAGMSDLKGGQSEINYIVLRYADILLMYAEAQNEAVGPDASVYDALNEVRTRAGMPEFDETYDKDQLRQIIRHERRIEFAGEGYYYNDIRRWKTAETVLNAPIKKYDGSVIETRKFNAARDYWWPIPQTELDLDSQLGQNDGY
jgi:hypothetical protein